MHLAIRHTRALCGLKTDKPLRYHTTAHTTDTENSSFQMTITRTKVCSLYAVAYLFKSPNHLRVNKSTKDVKTDFFLFFFDFEPLIASSSSLLWFHSVYIVHVPMCPECRCSISFHSLLCCVFAFVLTRVTANTVNRNARMHSFGREREAQRRWRRHRRRRITINKRRNNNFLIHFNEIKVNVLHFAHRLSLTLFLCMRVASLLSSGVPSRKRYGTVILYVP